jgi:hypothetical protein
METLLLALSVFALVFVGLGIRILIKKNGEFRGTCSTQKQALQDVYGIGCPVCGKDANEECRQPE